MNNRRIAVRGIIFKDGKILAQKLKPGLDGTEKDYWCTPGGGLETNESLTDGLIREIIEETGILPEIGKLLFIQQYNIDDREQMEFFFHIKNHEDFDDIDLSKTSHGEIEIQTVDFIDPSDNNILPNFLQRIDISNHLGNDNPVAIHNYLQN